MSSDDELIERLREILPTIDLQVTTEKMLRKKLEEEFNCDLTAKKRIIRDEINKYLAENEVADDEDAEVEGEEVEEEEVEEEEDSNEAKATKKRSGSSFGSVLSPQMKAFLGVDNMARTQVVKSLWVYIKENNLQDPKNKRNIILDDKLKTLFHHPLTMFSINKQLSRHCMTADALVGGGPREASAKPKVKNEESKKRPFSKISSKGGAKQGGESNGKTNNFAKPIQVSPEMAEFLGTPNINRAEMSKFFWDYFKKNGLLDPSDKRRVLCDAKLKSLTGESSFLAFGFQKLVKHHIL